MVGIAVGALLLLSSPAAAIDGFVAEPGLWAKVGWSTWSANEQYVGPFGQGELSFGGGRQLGDTVPISVDEGGGTFRTRSFTLDLRVDPTERLALGAHLSLWQTSVLELSTVRTTTNGTGDLYGYVSYALAPFDADVGTRIALLYKIPTTQTTFESLSVPLSEGQVDLGVEQSTSWRFAPRAMFSVRLAWRYRFAVEEDRGGTPVQIKPGNEAELGVEIAGDPLRSVWLRAGYNGMWAETSEDRTVTSLIGPRERRQIHNVELGMYWSFGALVAPPTSGTQSALRGLALDTWARYPLGGRRLSAGAGVWRRPGVGPRILARGSTGRGGVGAGTT